MPSQISLTHRQVNAFRNPLAARFGTMLTYHRGKAMTPKQAAKDEAPVDDIWLRDIAPTFALRRWALGRKSLPSMQPIVGSDLHP